MLLQNIPKRGERTGAAVLNDGVLSLELAESAMKHFMRHGAGKENQKIRIAQFVFQPTFWLGKNLCLTLIGFAEVLITTLHTFIPA